jgi:hypothetical protein
MITDLESPKKRSPGRPRKPNALPALVAHVRLDEVLDKRLKIERVERNARGRGDTIRGVITEALGLHCQVVRVLRVPVFSWEEDHWLAGEQLRLGCATRTDAVRALLDETRARG